MRSQPDTSVALTYEEKLQLKLICKAEGDVEHFDTIPSRVLVALRFAVSSWSETKNCYVLRATLRGREVAAAIGSLDVQP